MMRHVYGLLVVAVAGLFACSQPPGAPPALRPVGLAGDTVPAQTPPLRQATNGGGPSVLYLDFDGVTLTNATDYAPGNQSEIAAATVPAFEPPAGAKFTRQQGVDAVTDRLRQFYQRFNVQIVTQRPSSGDYTMIAIGGTHDVAQQPAGVAGVSPLDCTNANADNVVYDFSDDQTPDYGGLIQIAITAAHESGHSFGLEHTDNPADIMYSVANPMPTVDNLFHMSFTTGNYSGYNAGSESTQPQCGRPNPLDNAAILDSTVGANPNPGELNPPSLTWPFPILPQVPTPSFPVRFTASDDTAVTRLEIYKNAELIAVLTSPPYQADIDTATGEAFYLTVEAIDPNANRSTIIRTFTADTTNPPLCPDGTCANGLTCKEGLCRRAVGDNCQTNLQCVTNTCKRPTTGNLTICTQTCSGANPCPSGFVCGTDSLCAPGGMKVSGDSCAAAAECASGRCGNGVCVDACEQTACLAGFACMAVDGGMGCVAAPPSPAPMHGGGCDAGGGAPGGAGALALVLLAVIAARRRRGWNVF